MSQDNNQNDRDRQTDEQPEGWQQDEPMAREGRSDQPESEPIQAGATPQDVTPAADDLDDMDEEDRDDDDRDDGSPNRRRNIG
jgi:hypothetical protein